MARFLWLTVTCILLNWSTDPAWLRISRRRSSTVCARRKLSSMAQTTNASLYTPLITVVGDESLTVVTSTNRQRPVRCQFNCCCCCCSCWWWWRYNRDTPSASRQAKEHTQWCCTLHRSDNAESVNYSPRSCPGLYWRRGYKVQLILVHSQFHMQYSELRAKTNPYVDKYTLMSAYPFYRMLSKAYLRCVRDRSSKLCSMTSASDSWKTRPVLPNWDSGFYSKMYGYFAPVT